MISNAPYRTPAASAPDSAVLPRKGLLGYLDGSQPLWKAFWLVYVLGLFLLKLLVAVAPRSSLVIETIITYQRMTGLSSEAAVLSLLAPLKLGFLVFALLAVWRCAENTGLRLWTWLARLCVGLHGLWAASKLLGIFL